VKTVIIVIAIGTGCFAASCGKAGRTCTTKLTESNAADTVFSSPYIMAYPGSSWTYDNGTTQTCDSWEEIGIIARTQDDDCPNAHTTHTVVPSTSFGYIYGSDLLQLQGQASTKFLPLLATGPGIFLHTETHTGGQNNQDNGFKKTRIYEVVALYDMMTVAGTVYHDVIYVKRYESTYYYHISNGPYSTGHYFYANGVGLIRAETTLMQDTTVVMNLASYEIGPH
jgi:hypothetical protein